MATTYEPFHDGDDFLEIDVADPGYGYLTIHRADLDRSYTIAGPRLGQTLRDLTALALADLDMPGDVGFGKIARDDARRMLPAFQNAIVHAIAGTDRAERTIDRPDPDYTPEPYCARCDVANAYATANPHPNPWCEEHGHVVFGQAAEGDTRLAWDDARRRYDSQRQHRRTLRVLSSST